MIHHTVQKMKFSIMDFFSKCEQIRSFLRIWSHLLKKSWMETFIFCTVSMVHVWLEVEVLLEILIYTNNKYSE